MNQKINFLKQMAQALSKQFGSNCEVVIHDLTKKSIQKSIVYIENGHVTNRRLGDGPSHIVLETLKKTYVFNDMDRVDDHHRAVRICTSWATKEENVEQLCRDLKSLSNVHN